jgi:hypothetical protein
LGYQQGQYPQPQMVQNKPTAAYVLSLLGGIFGLIASIIFMGLGALAFASVNSYPYYYSSGFFDWGWSVLIGFGVWMLITAILIIVFAVQLNNHPMEHTKWGALILVFSIIGLGGLLGLIGGILALVYKPILAGQQPYGYAQPQYGAQPQYYGQQAPQQQVTRICPNCGRVIQENQKFCPYCGKQLG